MIDPRDSNLDLTILVTCYNEEEYIVDTLQSVFEAMKQVEVSYEVIVIDDASRDKSLELIRGYIAAHPEYPITLVANEKNRGFANNYVEGAFLGRGKYYHLVCGDDSMPANYLVDAYRLLGQADSIVPYQIQKEVRGKSLRRKWVSRTFTRLVNFLGGYHLHYYNGMAIHRRYDVMRWHPTSYGFGFQADILTMLLDQGNSYIQVYSCSVDRKGAGSTSISMRNFLSVCHTLLEITIRRIRRAIYGKDWPKPVEIKLEPPTSHGSRR